MTEVMSLRREIEHRKASSQDDFAALNRLFLDSEAARERQGATIQQLHAVIADMQHRYATTVGALGDAQTELATAKSTIAALKMQVKTLDAAADVTRAVVQRLDTATSADTVTIARDGFQALVTRVHDAEAEAEAAAMAVTSMAAVAGVTAAVVTRLTATATCTPVHTVFGAGTATAKRADGFTAVTLPWGTATLRDECIVGTAAYAAAQEAKRSATKTREVALLNGLSSLREQAQTLVGMVGAAHADVATKTVAMDAVMRQVCVDSVSPRS